LKEWFKDARWTYNRALQQVIEHHWHHATCTTTIATMESVLVRRYVTASGLRGRELLRTRTPKVIRQQAVKSLLVAIKGFRTKLQKQAFKIKHNPNNLKLRQPIRFNPTFKHRSLTRDTIRIEQRSLTVLDANTCSIFRTWKPLNLSTTLLDDTLGPWRERDSVMVKQSTPFSSIRTRCAVLRPEMVERDFGLHLSFGKIYLLLSHSTAVGTQTDEEHLSDVVAIDPGVRRFGTTYSPEGDVAIYGSNTTQVVDKLIRRIDRSKQYQSTARMRLMDLKDLDKVYQHYGHTFRRGDRHAKKQLRTKLWSTRKNHHRANRKAQNVIRNFHYNVAHDLLRRNKTIIYPTTSSHQWVRGKGLHRSVKRRAQMLAFGQFGRRLVETATMYKNRTILRGSEAYTSKQCGSCGSINERLGSTLARAQALVLHLYVQIALAPQIGTSMRLRARKRLLEIYCSD
jgi:transposase